MVDPLLPRVFLNVDAIPTSWRKIPQWVGFRLTPPKKPGGKPGKVPINPLTGTNASSTNANTWGTFTEAVGSIARFNNDGIGFVFSGSGLSGVDFDHCRDRATGSIDPAVMEKIQDLATYTEVSPTGTGLHCIAQGNLPGRGIKVGDFEMYDDGRFFTVTGQHLAGTPTEVEPRPTELAELYNALVGSRGTRALPIDPPASPPALAPASEVATPLTRNEKFDDAIMQKLFAGKNGEKARALFSGDISAYPSQSEAELALCSLIAAEASNDPSLVDRLFRRSNLIRPKWDNQRGDKTYGQWTVARACAPKATNGARPRPPGRKEILVLPGELPKVTDEAEQVLLALSQPEIFQRDCQLMRIARTKKLERSNGIERPEGAVILVPLDAPYLVDFLTRKADWSKYVRKEKKAIDAPAKVARTYLARAGEWKVPPLLAVIETPTIRADGSVLDTPRYDPWTHLYFDPGGTVFPPINPNPTRDDALAALAKFDPILKDFPWSEPCDRSAALAAMLTPLVRRTLKTAPMFVFRAPTMASGKSLLADVVALLATGRVASVLTQGKDDDEQQKRILAILVEGDAVNSIDNVDRPLGGPDLCAILTQQSYQGRVLGLTKMVRAPTCTTWLATGNNLVIEGDLTTRVILCDLSPECERPGEREFEINLHEYVPAQRGELVVAGLTIMLAYLHAGRPDLKIKTFGRFEDWSAHVRAPLVWLGLPDPLDSAARLEDIDPVRRLLREFLRMWRHVFQEQEVAASEVVEIANKAPTCELAALVSEATKLQAGKITAQAVGLYLRRMEKRIESGLCFRKFGESGGSARWRVIEVAGGLEGLRGLAGATREEFRDSSERNPEREIPLGEQPPQLPQVPLEVEGVRASDELGDTATVLPSPPELDAENGGDSPQPKPAELLFGDADNDGWDH